MRTALAGLTLVLCAVYFLGGNLWNSRRSRPESSSAQRFITSRFASFGGFDAAASQNSNGVTPRPEWPRYFSTMKGLVLIFPALVLCGCASLAPDGARIELEHISHPLVGQPFFGGPTEEDALTQANAILHWQRGRFYVEQGVGYNLLGRDGGGFYGPGFTYTARAGVSFHFTKPD